MSTHGGTRPHLVVAILAVGAAFAAVSGEVWPGPPMVVGAEASAAAPFNAPPHAEQCMNCMDCSDGESHYDYHPGLEQGELTGGTFVNLCRVAYSICPGLHQPCQPHQDEDEDTETLPLTPRSLDLLEDQLANRVPGSAIEDRLVAFPWATLNEESGAVEVRNCEGELVAHFPAP